MLTSELIEDIWSLKWSPNDTLLATGCDDGSVNLIEFSAENLLYVGKASGGGNKRLTEAMS